MTSPTKPPPIRTGVLRGYGFMAALGAATLSAAGAGLLRDGHVDAAHDALERRAWLEASDELLRGRVGDGWRAVQSTAAAQPVVARLPSTWRERLRAVAGLRDGHPSPAGSVATTTSRSPDPRPGPVDSRLVAPEQLDPFFDDLDALERGSRPKVRVLFFGTSEIGHDVVTSQMRRNLQAQFGDGGKGWVLIDRTWSILDHRDIDWRYEDTAWVSFSIRTGTRKDGRYGLGGVVHLSRRPTVVEYGTVGPDYGVRGGYNPFPAGTRWSRIELHYREYPGGGPVALQLDGRRLPTLQTSADTPGDGMFTLDVPDGPHRLRVAVGKQPVQLYGGIFERDRGLVVDALMIIGAWGDSILNYDDAHLAAAIARRKPSLLIFQYGAKEVLRSPELSAQQVRHFTRGFRQSVERVRRAQPDAACLIISPKDQARLVAGRLQTSPGIPKVVDASAEVARQCGCAFYNLYAAMGGEGTIRRWYHQTPPLVLGDYKHLSPAGSIRVGDLLSDVLLDQRLAYQRWRGRAEKGTAASAESTLSPPSPEQIRAFHASDVPTRLDEPKPCKRGSLQVIDCRDPLTYIRTNERGHPLWEPLIENAGGGYVGVGAEENYSLMAAARSEWAWIVTADPTLVRMHRLLQTLIAAHPTADGLVGALDPARAAQTRDRLSDALAGTVPELELRRTMETFDDLRPDLHLHLRRGRRQRPLFPTWGWLQATASYEHIRQMVQHRRVRILSAEPTGEHAMSLGAGSARSLGVSVRVVYLSNEESRRRRMRAGFRAGLLAAPFDDNSVVLRTVPGRWNRAEGFSRWHYNAHHGLHLQALLGDPDFGRPLDVLDDRHPLSDYSSWLGPERGPVLAQTTEAR